VSFVDLARGLIHFVSGDAMIKLGQTYSSMERHHDALALKERVLEFNRRVLPKDHPSIGAAKFHPCLLNLLVYCSWLPSF